MSLLHTLLPHAPGGASQFGVSFLTGIVKCPFKSALSTIAPHPAGGRGLVTTTKASPLLAGGSFHLALETWYHSRCVNPSTGEITEDHGQPDLERSRDAILNHSAEHAHEWESPEQREVDTQLTLSWLTRYHDFYGPKGAMPEFPEVRVYVDETGPWIEREVSVPLVDDLYLTSRIDLVASDGGHPCVYEHKTTSAGQFFALQDRMHLSAQPTAELLALQVGSGLPFVPSACVVNILCKNAGKGPNAKTQPFARPRVSRTEADLVKFRHDVVSWLRTYEGYLDQWNELTTVQGVDDYEAIRRVFPRTGTLNGTCNEYFRQCQFWGLCCQTGREDRGAGAFAARVGPPSIHSHNHEDE